MAWLTLERPPLNVLDLAALRQLGALLDGMAARPGVKVLGLRSTLPGVFSAGNHVKDHTRERAPEMLQAFHHVVRTLDTLPQPTLAAVDGLCLGGGCELALACDLVVASPASSFGFPEIDVGCYPPVAAAWLGPQAGRIVAEMVFTGRRLDAAEALRWGLVNRVAEDAPAQAEALATAIAGKSAAVLAVARRVLRASGQGSREDDLQRAEQEYEHALLPTDDAAEGVDAFLEKRRPRWRDR